MKILFLLVIYILLVHSEVLEDVLSIALCIAKCSDEVCRNKCNKTEKNISEITFLNEKSITNVSLQCKDVNSLVLKHNPGIYVIEMKSKNNDIWLLPTMSNASISKFTQLNSDNFYQFRIYQVTPHGVALPEITNWFKTNEVNYIPKEVKNISISSVEIDTNNLNQMQVNLTIDPANDLNCLYNIIQWGGEHHLYEYELDVVQNYNLKLRHLDYNRTNIIYVSSRNKIGSRESKNTSLTFVTPTCLDIHHNLSVCAPPPVEEMEIICLRSDKTFVDLKVYWKKPVLQPNNYTIVVYPFESESNHTEITVHGNESSAYIPNVIFSIRYKIGVISESRGGTSMQSKIFKMKEQSMAVTQVIVAISTLMTLAIVLSITYTYCRYKHIKDHVCRYNFFQNIDQKNCAFEDVKRPLKSAYETVIVKNKPRDPFEISIDRLRFKKILGSGIGGIVKLASLQDDQKRNIDVAVKMLRENASADDMKNFYREISLMKSAGNHPNIVSLIGCATLNKNPLLIVEYCSKGDLQTYLRTILEEVTTTIVKQSERSNLLETSNILYFFQEHSNLSDAINNHLYDLQEENNVERMIENRVTPMEMLNFALQVATGMEFLSSNRIVHRDLAARNVLVCNDTTVKISDFGLSRDIYQENVYKERSNKKLPLKWMAIEALTHQAYTTRSDVWSFGILLYEIVTLGGTPYPEFQSSQVLHLLKAGYRMERPSNCGYKLYEIMCSCWHENPLNRPTFTQLKQQFDTLLSNSTKNEYLNWPETFHNSTEQSFTAFESKIQNILTLPNIS